MTDDVSNIAPEFDEAGLIELAEAYERLLPGWTSASAMRRKVVEHIRVLRDAIKAHDRLRERCLMAETRERLTLSRLAELERQ